MAVSIYDHITENKIKSALLLAIFAAIVLGAAYLYGYVYGNPEAGLFYGGIFTVFYGLTGYYAGGSIALAVNGAKKITKRDNNELYSMIDALAIASGLPTPEIYIMETDALNAFATGRDPQHSAIAVTRGLLNTLDTRELRGVLAHEMSHIGNYDIRLQTLVIVLVGVFTLLSDFFLRLGFHSDRDSKGKGAGVIMIIAIVLAILSPVIATLIKLAISRKREFLADQTGAVLISDPEALASALEKIAGDKHEFASANHATAHLYIASPFKKNFWNNLFATHPPIEERIKLLRNI